MSSNIEARNQKILAAISATKKKAKATRRLSGSSDELFNSQSYSENRDGMGVFGSFVNLFKSYLGTGLLALPFAMGCAGTTFHPIDPINPGNIHIPLPLP